MYHGLIHEDVIYQSKKDAFDHVPFLRHHCNSLILHIYNDLQTPVDKDYARHIKCCKECNTCSKELKDLSPHIPPTVDHYVTIQVGDIRSLAYGSYMLGDDSDAVKKIYNAPEVCILDITDNEVLVAQTFPYSFKELADKGDLLVSDGQYYVEMWNTYTLPKEALTDFSKETYPIIYIPKAVSKKTIKTILAHQKKKIIISNSYTLKFREMEKAFGLNTRQYCYTTY